MSQTDASPTIVDRIAFVDSSALVALADAGDASHAAAVAAYEELRASGYRFFSTDLLLTEAFELLASALGQRVAAAWLKACRLPVHYVDERDFAAARDRIANAQRPLGLTDAISAAVVARYGIQDVFAVDPQVLDAVG